MKHPLAANAGREPPISAAAASALLRFGYAPQRRPIDDVIDRLAAPDGESWYAASATHVLADVTRSLSISAAATGPNAKQEALGAVSLANLVRVKDGAKASLHGAPSTEARLTAILMYFLAVGAALALFDELITSMAREELEDALIDLAEASPADWKALLRHGALGQV